MASSKALCCFCRLPRADLRCQACSDDVCRTCIEHLPEETFRFLSKKPENLAHSSYCPRCFGDVVEPAIASYNETLARAKNVGFWAKTYRGHVPVIRKALEEIQVEGGSDRDEVLLHLGFIAAEMGYNGLIRGQLVSKKVRDHGYQKMLWSGHALPCEVDEGKLERSEFREAHWRVLHHR